MSNDNPDTAALDLDAIRKRAVLYRANQMQHEKTYDRAAGLTAAAFLCAQDVPTLLDALAAAREEMARFGTNAELLSCSTMGDAFDRMEQTVRERDAAREELAEAKAILRDPVVSAVVELIAQRDREYRRAEAAHDAKDEANRRWLEVETKATRCPVLHEDGVTRCHDDAGHTGVEHVGTGPDGPKTWSVAAVPGDGEQAATTCTCPPKTNNQKDPTIMQVEFTPAYLLGAWQEDPDCPQHGATTVPTSGQA